MKRKQTVLTVMAVVLACGLCTGRVPFTAYAAEEEIPLSVFEPEEADEDAPALPEEDEAQVSALEPEQEPEPEEEGAAEDAYDAQGDGTESGTGDSTGDGTGDSTGDGTGDSTGDGTGDSTGDETGDSTGDETGDDTEQTDVHIAGVSNFAPANRVWFYNMWGDMMLVESNGHWGLIDTGHRYEDTITDRDGTVYNLPFSDGLSNQYAGKNGRDAMIYMVETLGVTHLDFIIGTHAHSDHIGGIPEIAELLVAEDASSEGHSLIDDTTVFFYKTYHACQNTVEDDLTTPGANTWHNQAFLYRALEALREKGALLVDVSTGIVASYGNTVSSDQSANIAKMKQSGVFSNITYEPRSQTDPYDDRLSFSWGNMKIDLYHLFAVEGARGENVNCLVTVLTCGAQKVYLGADIDMESGLEQAIVWTIAKDHDAISVAKTSHHGYSNSNSKVFADMLKPKLLIRSAAYNRVEEPQEGGDLSSLRYYAYRQFGTSCYEVGAAEHMLAVVLDGAQPSLYNVTGEGAEATFSDPSSCKDALVFDDGWSGWEWDEVLGSYNRYYYFENNLAVTGWKEIKGERYFFDKAGFMKRGWLKNNGKWYRLNNFGKMETGWYYEFFDTGYRNASGATVYMRDQSLWAAAYYLGDDGAMHTGWVKEDGIWYYLNGAGVMQTGWVKSGYSWYYMDRDSGAMATGWVHDGRSWYYLGDDGILRTGWVKVDDTWYYLEGTGEMLTGWLYDGGSWYYMDRNSGAMRTGWVYDAGKWYYMLSSGTMLKNAYILENGKHYYFDATGMCLNP